ncbi:MAG: DUF2079 domain-containing protein [Leptospirales bacterium]|nr:DUF2079 domain-containing protein [Leptospirales bacterium]
MARLAADAALPLGRDLGYYLQMLEGLRLGRGSASRILGTSSVFETHFSPIYYVVVYFYDLLRAFLAPLTAGLLLGGLSLLAALLMLSNIGSKRGPLRGPWLAASLLLTFCNPLSLQLFVHGPRDMLLALPALAGMLWAYEARRPALFVLASAICLACREDLLLLFPGFALAELAAARRRPRWILLFLAVFGAGALAITLTSLLTVERPALTGLERYRYLGDGWSQILLSPLLNPHAFLGGLWRPVNGRFVFQLALSFAFLPLLRPRLLLVAAPYAVLLMLNGDEIVVVQTIHGYYAAALLPPLLLAALQALGDLQHRASNAGPLAWLAPGALLLFYLWGGPLWRVLTAPDGATTLRQDIEKLRHIAANDPRPLYAPWAILPYTGDLLQSATLRLDQPASGLAVIPADLSRPDLLPEGATLHAYRLWLLERNIDSRQVARSGALALIDLDRRAAPGHLPLYQAGAIEINARYTIAENQIDPVEIRDQGRMARIVGGGHGPGFPPARREMVSGLNNLQGLNLKTISVLVRRQSSERCPPAVQPQLIALYADGSRQTKNLVADSDRYQWQTMNLDARRPLAFAALTTRACGLWLLDRWRLEESSTGAQ